MKQLPQLDEQRCYERSSQQLSEIFAFVGSIADKADLGPKDRYALKFAAEELFTNFVKYNEGVHAIQVRLKINDGELALELEDHGVADFDPAKAKDPKVEAGIEQRVPGGLGLHLVRSLFDSLEYQYRDGVLKVLARKARESPA